MRNNSNKTQIYHLPNCFAIGQLAQTRAFKTHYSQNGNNYHIDHLRMNKNLYQFSVMAMMQKYEYSIILLSQRQVLTQMF